MSVLHTDIVISGGGVAGLTAAAAFGQAGFSVLLTDPNPPVTAAQDPGADLRTTAFLQPSQRLLDQIGLWERLAPHATPLQVMAIMDLASGRDRAPHHAFDAADISDQPFGWNLPNWLLRREMLAELETLPNVTLRLGTATKAMLARTSEARVTLTDGTRITARLVIAADGRNSALRDSAGISTRTYRYGQKALAFAVTHTPPHNNISTEIHRDGGPFTLVPLPDLDGQPRSAVVWMTKSDENDRLLALSETDFNAEITDRSGGLLGPLALASRRSQWPIISQIADSFAAERLALMAEAAHVVPPIGAQGLNMSLGDIATLLDLAQARPDALGNPKMLQSYTRTRRPEVRARVTGVDLLNRASIAGEPMLQRLRAEATGLLHGVRPVRQAAMQLGLGSRA